ncbi:EamA family transporter [Thiohalophilus sp.]|uniref:EamA family transporter n=1 Tax=Thiohalophilus sp. TaxID=3028392 RepID=UPI002ACE53FE|nr:EamA family transporter [Thiohalophilus sp.]MDZ7803242.1 EamA family transporter [Thiohalophilus sp.]
MGHVFGIPVCPAQYYPGSVFLNLSRKQALMYQILITIVVLFPFGSAVMPQVSAVQWGQLLLLGVIFTALPHTLFLFICDVEAKTASLVACLQVVYATLFSVVVGEWPVITTVIGGFIVVTAAMFETYVTGRRR